MEGKGVFQHEPCELVPVTPIGGGERLDLYSHGHMLPAGRYWSAGFSAERPSLLRQVASHDGKEMEALGGLFAAVLKCALTKGFAGHTSPWISLWDGSIKGRLWNKTLVKLYLFAEADSDTRDSV
mgnify:CR=1 FL=1